MDPQEVLRKARQEGNHEMEASIREKSFRWTYLTMALVAAIFAYIRERQGQPMMDLCVTVCASVTVGQFYQFAKTKDKSCLIMGSITLFIGIVGLIRFVMGH